MVRGLRHKHYGHTTVRSEEAAGEIHEPGLCWGAGHGSAPPMHSDPYFTETLTKSQNHSSWKGSLGIKSNPLPYLHAELGEEAAEVQQMCPSRAVCGLWLQHSAQSICCTPLESQLGTERHCARCHKAAGMELHADWLFTLASYHST